MSHHTDRRRNLLGLLKRSSAMACLAMVLFSGSISFAARSAPVTVKEDADSFTLANGLVIARVEKRTGDLFSLQYKGKELMASGEGSTGGYWSSVGRARAGGRHVTAV